MSAARDVDERSCGPTHALVRVSAQNKAKPSKTRSQASLSSQVDQVELNSSRPRSRQRAKSAWSLVNRTALLNLSLSELRQLSEQLLLERFALFFQPNGQLRYPYNQMGLIELLLAEKKNQMARRLSTTSASGARAKQSRNGPTAVQEQKQQKIDTSVSDKETEVRHHETTTPPGHIVRVIVPQQPAFVDYCVNPHQPSVILLPTQLTTPIHTYAQCPERALFVTSGTPQIAAQTGPSHVFQQVVVAPPASQSPTTSCPPREKKQNSDHECADSEEENSDIEEDDDSDKYDDDDDDDDSIQEEIMLKILNADTQFSQQVRVNRHQPFHTSFKPKHTRFFHNHRELKGSLTPAQAKLVDNDLIVIRVSEQST